MTTIGTFTVNCNRCEKQAECKVKDIVNGDSDKAAVEALTECIAYEKAMVEPPATIYAHYGIDTTNHKLYADSTELPEDDFHHLNIKVMIDTTTRADVAADKLRMLASWIMERTKHTTIQAQLPYTNDELEPDDEFDPFAED